MRRTDVTGSPAAAAAWVRTPALTAAGPPSTTSDAGRSRASSAAVAPGSEDGPVNSTGPPRPAAAGPAANASAKPVPVARYATATRGEKVDAETAAAVP